VSTVPGQFPAFEIKRHKVFLASVCILAISAVTALIQLGSLGPSDVVYVFLAGVVVLSSFAFLLHPFVNLGLTVFYLIGTIAFLLEAGFVSVAIAVLLIWNCFAGIVLVSGFKLPFPPGSLRVPLLLCLIAAFGAVYGIARGNRASWAMGDGYQIVEFALLFFLTQVLVKTEKQFQTMANVIVGTVIAASALQTADGLMGASYLPHLNQRGVDVARTINLNAPIAFVVLLATLTVAKTKKWILAGMGILAVNLIWSFTRGLWVATFVSALFLLMLLRSRARRTILKWAFASCLIVTPVLYASGLGSVIVDRIGFSVVQFSSASEENQVQSGRRILEYLLILPQVAEHPIVGKGLGATFEIAGDAILEGPKGEQVDHHYIHDLYLQVAFRLGVPVLIIFLVLLWKYFRRCIKNLRTLNLSPENSAVMAGLIAAMLGEAVLSLTSPTILNHPTAGLIGCIMAMTVTALRPGLSRRPEDLAAN
jgi:O-antigen ligase